MFTFNVNHTKCEILKGDDIAIVLYMDDETTVHKETHVFNVIDKASAKGVATIGMTSEAIAKTSATGTWEDRYILEYV